MRSLLLASLLVAGLAAAAGATEVVVPVRPGDRLSLRNQDGEIRVASWKGRSVRIQAEHAPGVEVRVAAAGRTHTVEAMAPHGRAANVRYRVQVPAWLPIAIEGRNSPVFIEGLEDEVHVSTVNGSVVADGNRGSLVLSSVNGSVRVREARGRVRASSVNRDVALEDVEGNVFGEAVNGDIVLRTVTGDTIFTTTVRGDVYFAGRFRPKGVYVFSSHSGDVKLRLPRETDARVESFVVAGDLITNAAMPETAWLLPRTRERERIKRYKFQLGSGEALLKLESFQGNIELDWLENSRIR